MRNKIIPGILSVALLLAASLSAEAKPEIKAGGLISGKQYLVLIGGARVIPDNQIYYIPCNSIDCDGTYNSIQLNYSAFNDKWNNYRKTRNSLVMGLGDCAASRSFDSCEKEMRQGLSNLGTAPLTSDGYLESKFQYLSQIASLARTDFDGNYKIDCPTVKCLVFSTGLVENIKGYWVQLASSNSNLDLANSTLIHYYDLSKFR